jgi:hypothetical protein
VPNRSKGKDQKCCPWYATLGVGFEDNGSAPKKLMLPTEGGGVTQGCSAGKEEKYYIRHTGMFSRLLL